MSKEYYYEVRAYNEGEEVFMKKYKTRQSAFAKARKLKVTNNYDCVYIDLYNNEFLEDSYTVYDGGEII